MKPFTLSLPETPSAGLGLGQLMMQAHAPGEQTGGGRGSGDGPTPTRFIRVIAFDPLCSDGNRLHEKLEVGFDPAFTLQTFINVLNYAAGETVYAPEGGSIADAIHYTASVPYQIVTDAYSPFANDPASPLVHLSGDQFAGMLRSRGPWPYQDKNGNAGMSAMLDPGFLGFNLVDDINAQKFHLAIFACPGAGMNEGAYTGLAEAYMIAGEGDFAAIPTNGGRWFVPGVEVGRRVVMLMSNLTRGPDLTVHSWIHAQIDAGVLRAIWDSPSTDDIQRISSPLSLWMANGDPTSLRLNGRTGLQANASLGDAHRNPNSFTDYGLADTDVVPSNALSWTAYPDAGPWHRGRLDLDDNTRRAPVGTDAWMGLTQFPDYCRCQAWQLRRIPRGAGMVDGRWADWWRYLLDANEQTGRGQPITKPVDGPRNGARDARLQVDVLPDGNRQITVSWDISQDDDPGVYAVVRLMSEWELLGGDVIRTQAHSPARISYTDVVPADGQARFYAVLWAQAGWLQAPKPSDVLAVAPGTAGGTTGFVQADVALYQGNVPYLTTQDMTPLAPGGTIRLVDSALVEVMRVPVFAGQQMYSLADRRQAEGISAYYLGSFGPHDELLGWSDLLGVYRGVAQV